MRAQEMRVAWEADQFDFGEPKPAGMSSSGNRVVHGIVSYEEECLQELYTPTKSSRLTSFLRQQSSDTIMCGLGKSMTWHVLLCWCSHENSTCCCSFVNYICFLLCWWLVVHEPSRMFVAHRAQSGHDSSFLQQHCTRSSVICSGEELGKSESCVKMCALCTISCGIMKQVTRSTLWTHPTASVGISYTSGRSVIISEVILERYKIRESIN